MQLHLAVRDGFLVDTFAPIEADLLLPEEDGWLEAVEPDLSLLDLALEEGRLGGAEFLSLVRDARSFGATR